MEFALLGWPVDEPRLRLDYRRFSYAGKFVTGKTGIAVVRGEPPDAHDATPVNTLSSLPDNLRESEFDNDILAAVAFNVDRTDSNTLWLRYLTVRSDLRNSGLQLGPRLVAFITAHAAENSFKRVRIAVNNVFSYHALYKAGFATTGRETGLAELILERPAGEQADVSTWNYQHGLDQFRQREGLSTAEREFLQDHKAVDPPEPIGSHDSPDPLGTDGLQHPPETVDSGVSNPPSTSK